MKRKSEPRSPAREMRFPGQFKPLIEEKIIFQGNLTEYHKELLGRLEKTGPHALRNDTDKCWEIPQMVAFDPQNNAVLIAIRNTGDDDSGEGEFLLASADNEFIMHLSAEMDEDIFFQDCIDLIHANIISFRWESFLYDDNGQFQGFLHVEKLEGAPPRKTVTVSRTFSEDTE